MKTTFRLHEGALPTIDANAPPISVPSASGGHVDASCNETITITCLLELYNAVGYKASANIGNQIAVTGYLEQFANIADLQLFYADQRPDALNSSFKVVSVNGGQNNQTADEAGDEANLGKIKSAFCANHANALSQLDTQFAFGLTHPIPPTFFTTGGSPPFIPDIGTPTDTNEPYLNVCYALFYATYS